MASDTFYRGGLSELPTKLRGNWPLCAHARRFVDFEGVEPASLETSDAPAARLIQG